MPHKLSKPLELHKCRRNTEGRFTDACLVARFSSVTKAERWLTAQGYGHLDRDFELYLHSDASTREDMDTPAYRLVNVPVVPEDPAK